MTENNKTAHKFIEELQADADKHQQYFSWITDFELTTKTVYDIMRGGRARCKIENAMY